MRRPQPRAPEFSTDGPYPIGGAGYRCRNLARPCHPIRRLGTLYGVDVTVGEDEQALFTTFVEEAEPRLRRALTALRGRQDGLEATAAALAWAWENWHRVQAMSNPIGYLYKVGVSNSRPPQAPVFLEATPDSPGAFEPELVPALARLSERQRSVVVLVHGCGWTYQEVAEALGLTKPTVGTHLRRAMAQLRSDLGADA